MAATKSVTVSTGTGTSDTNLWQSILAEATESVHRSQEGHLLVGFFKTKSLELKNHLKQTHLKQTNHLMTNVFPCTFYPR